MCCWVSIELKHTVLISPICFRRKSASCTHVSALLHALNDLNPPSLHLKPKLPVADMGEEDEEVMPSTSLPHAWGIPSKKRKDCTIEVSSAVFEKHDHARPGKKRYSLLKTLIQGHQNLKEPFRQSFLSFWTKLRRRSSVYH